MAISAFIVKVPDAESLVGALRERFERRAVKGRDQGDVDSSAADGEDRTEEGGQRGVLLCRPFWVFNVA